MKYLDFLQWRSAYISRAICLFIAMATLVACGSGGSGGGDSTTGNCGISDCSPQALISVPSITASAGQEVSLDGSPSRPSGSLTYRWEQISGQSVEIEDADKPVARFVAPTLDIEQSLVFRLVVSNGYSDSLAEIGVVVKPLRVSIAVSSTTAVVGNPISLRAVGVDDGGELLFLWEQIDDAGVEVAIVNADSATASFATQVVIDAVTARFRVIVTNKFGATAQAEVSIDFEKGILPAITAATPSHAAIGEEIKLSGSGFTNLLSVHLVKNGVRTEIDESALQVISDHELRFTVPPIEAGNYVVDVDNSGGKASAHLVLGTALKNVIQIAAGHSHYCGVLLDSTAVCWGDNADGELGNNSLEASGAPTQVQFANKNAMDGVTAIAAGIFSSCALRSDQTVWCWGNNSHGQLGVGGTENHSYAVQVQGLPSGIVSISGAAYHYCALNSVGEAYCWGENSHGQIQDPAAPSVTPKKVALTEKISSIDVGERHTCGLVARDKSVLCWGDNTFGQLGNGSNLNSSIPVSVINSDTGSNLIGISAVSVGQKHSCALAAGGRVYCWGENGDGQLGVGDFENRLTAATVKNENGENSLEGVTAINVGRSAHREAGGSGRTCILKNTRKLYCWGDNNYGQLGDKSISARSIPVEVRYIQDINQFAIGRAGGCAVVADNSIYCWGANDEAQLGRAYARLGGVPMVVENLSNIVAISAGGTSLIEASFSCGLSTSGLVSCWGHNDKGQLGIGTQLDSATPVPVSLSNVTAIASGGSHSCAVSEGQVFCWGSNTNRNSLNEHTGNFTRTMKLGSGTIDQSLTPLLVNNLADIKSVAAGAEHSCALSRSGDVYCWGDGAAENPSISAFAARITQLPAKATQIAAGASNSCALLETGDIYCWHGSVPTRVSMPLGVSVLTIAVGLNQSCATAVGGSVYCWGGNDFGQLGNGTTGASSIPVEVVGINNAQGVAASGVGIFFYFYGYSCALQSHNNGSVSCWGANEFDQLGDGSGVNQSTPVAIKGLHGIKQIASGGTHSCALYHDGYVACWGGFFGGQLGQTPLSPRAVLQ